MIRERRSTRSRFLWGVVLMVIGICTLAAQLGFYLPYRFWEFWPVVPFTIGFLMMIWPGTARERLGGFWMLSVGIYGFMSSFKLFGLGYGSWWPVLIVALGIYVVLTGIFRDDSCKTQNQGGSAP